MVKRMAVCAFLVGAALGCSNSPTGPDSTVDAVGNWSASMDTNGGAIAFVVQPDRTLTNIRMGYGHPIPDPLKPGSTMGCSVLTFGTGYGFINLGKLSSNGAVNPGAPAGFSVVIDYATSKPVSLASVEGTATTYALVKGDFTSSTQANGTIFINAEPCGASPNTRLSMKWTATKG
jgi:hypothetical protein